MSTSPIIVGVDPGASGGVAIGRGSTPVLLKYNKEEIRRVFKDRPEGDIFVFVELVHSSPVMGQSQAFAFGRNVGWYDCLLETYVNEVHWVTPQSWMKPYANALASLKRPGMKPDAVKRARKNYLKAMAAQLYPEIKGLSLDTSDALLIYHHGLTAHNLNRKEQHDT